MAETAEETAALSRAKLEQKDRAELAAIVEAMGGKATSRAKKADLVELVLQLAGATSPAPEPKAKKEEARRSNAEKRHNLKPLKDKITAAESQIAADRQNMSKITFVRIRRTRR
jgi:hypothetical protein